MRGKSRIRAIDVAKAAGVSTATVSYVLNDTPGQKISDATAQRVREIADQLGYVRNRAALALARGDSGISIVDFSVFPRSQAADDAINAFIRRIESEGCTVVRGWWGPEEWEQNLVPLAIATNASSVITVTPVSDETRSALRHAGVGTVSSLLPAMDQLMVPLQMAGEAQVSHLAERGHRHVLYAPDLTPELAMLNTLRSGAGARRAAELGITWSELEVPNHPGGYYEALERARRKTPTATAICAYNDEVALKCLSALQAMGVEVPQEMALIGIDNLAFTVNTYPPLTTVEYQFSIEELSSTALATLLDRPGVTGLAKSEQSPIAVNVIERGTT